MQVDDAKLAGKKSVLLTFFPHPRMVLQKDTTIALINTIEERTGPFLTSTFSFNFKFISHSNHENLGVDIDNLIISQPDHGEQALEITWIL